MVKIGWSSKFQRSESHFVKRSHFEGKGKGKGRKKRKERERGGKERKEEVGNLLHGSHNIEYFA